MKKRSLSTLILFYVIVLILGFSTTVYAGERLELVNIHATPANINDIESATKSISDDGRYVVFSEVVPAADDFSNYNLIIFDRLNKTYISPSTFGSGANITKDGTSIIFSEEPSLYAEAWYLTFYDRLTEAKTTMLSPKIIYSPYITDDAKYVVFMSPESLLPADTNLKKDIYRYEIQTGELKLISANDSGVIGNGDSDGPTVSEDGRYVVFHSSATNLVSNDSGNGGVFLKDISTNQITKIASGVADAFISANGKIITFSGVTGSITNVFIYNTATKTIELISKTSSGVEGNGWSRPNSISEDGRFVLFTSEANNLVENDTNAKADVFLKDLETNTLSRISVSNSGEQANSWAVGTSISDNGRYITFTSLATNLVPNAPLGNSRVYVYDRYADDVTAPVTTCSISGVLGSGGSYASNVQYTLSASDGTGSGVAKIEYSFDNQTWEAYVNPITINKESGANYLWFRATDLTGKVETARNVTISIE